jgi:hypothetical protein
MIGPRPEEAEPLYAPRRTLGLASVRGPAFHRQQDDRPLYSFTLLKSKDVPKLLSPWEDPRNEGRAGTSSR